MLSATSKKQRLKQRESLVLQCARTIITEQGLIELKMPLLAKKAGISIGSLYRHFENREDLITALAALSLRTRRLKLETVCSYFSDDKCKLLAVPMMDFLFNVNHAEAFHSEIACTNESFLENASERRVLSYTKEEEYISSFITKVITESFYKDTDKTINVGIWALVNGMTLVWHSQKKTSSNDKAINFFRPHLLKFFDGYLPEAQITQKDILYVEEKLMKNISDWTWKINGELHE